MADERILIEGKEYISSSRASKLVGYTKDYVGQLARDGKIDAKRVGRNWYIGEDSITKHKLSVHYVLTKPKKAKSSEKTENEIVNENIVKSDVASQPSVSRFDQESSVPQKNILNLSEEKSVDDTLNIEDVDVHERYLPPLKKKSGNRDALLHSDIRYEKYEPQKPVRRESSSYDFVPIRAPINREVRDSFLKKDVFSTRSLANEETPRRRRVLRSASVPAIDGVIVSAPSPNKIRTTLLEKRDISTSKEHISTKVHENYSEPLQEEVTKTVPVVSAIVVFTILVLAYIFFVAQ